MGEKHILDATCGSRTIWFDKNCNAAVFMDKRIEHDTAIWKSTKNDSVRTLDVEPDIVADFTDMPFGDSSFELVVFDPPHLIRVGENAWMKKKYGKLPENWQQLIHDGFWECMRVLKPYGTLIFKWSDVQISTREVINAIGKEPLFGHRSGKAMKTHWMCFMKFPVSIEKLDVRHGKWVQDEPATIYCSECTYRVWAYNNTPYCPNCGANMHGGNNG